MSTKRKGSISEYKTFRMLEKQGYSCTKSGGSLGAWDIIAINSEGFILVQVKSNAWPGTKEMTVLKEFKVPSNCIKLVHRWDDYARAPKVRIVEHV